MTIQERIANYPTGGFLIGGLVVAGAYFFTFFDSGAVQDSRIAELTTTIVKTREDLAATQKLAEGKIVFEQEIDLVSKRLSKALELLPTSMKDDLVLDRISREANAAGVDILTTKPKQGEVKNFYEELQIDIEMRGTYSQLTAFLSMIAASRNQRIMSLRDLQLEFSGMIDEAALLKMKGTLVAYRYVESAKTPPTTTPPPNGGKG
ncbi:MAG: type 4a pilus biogenesis protein PilO [Bdellovibrionales bacterium]|nr:type 4a pilus biogenesis protein PilO [Bdellovibrionales bacterium]